MANGIKALRKVQLGGETVPGTSVTPTKIWRGTGGMPKSDLTIQIPEEDVGIYGGTNRHFVSQILGTFALDEVPATFEQLPLLLEAGVKAATPAQDGTGAYYRTYPMPTTAQNTVKTLSIEAGDNIAVEKIDYAFLNSISLSGSIGEPWMMSAEGTGREWTPTTSFTSLTLSDVEEILFTKTKLFVGAVGATLDPGGEITGLLRSAKVEINTGIVPVFTASGTLVFTTYKTTAPEITIEVTFEHNSDSKAEKVKFTSSESRKIKLKATGSAIGTPGPLYPNKTIVIEAVGFWESWESLGEQDGNDVVTAVFRSKYDTTASKWADIVIANSIALLWT